VERKGLLEAIREFITLINEKKEIRNRTAGIKSFLFNEQTIHIFRMIQEPLHNPEARKRQVPLK